MVSRSFLVAEQEIMYKEFAWKYIKCLQEIIRLKFLSIHVAASLGIVISKLLHGLVLNKF